MREPKRIPYHTWANSQLSVARHYGGCIFNGVQYKLDYDNCPTEGEDDNIRYFPDLVEVMPTKKRRLKPAKGADALPAHQPNNVNEETK